VPPYIVAAAPVPQNELEELLDRELDEELLEDELVDDELLDDELLDDELLDEELLDDEELELLDEELDEDELDAAELEELLEEALGPAPPPEAVESGDVGVVVQPASPAARAAAGAPESSSRQSRRFVRSVDASGESGASGRSMSDMQPPRPLDRPHRADGSRLFGGLRTRAHRPLAPAELATRLRQSKLDPPDHVICRDEVHAARQVAHRVHAELLRGVLRVAVAQRACARLPAAAVVAAPQRPPCGWTGGAGTP
jgi:hypothetical protein